MNTWNGWLRLAQRPGDHLKHCVRIGQNIVVPESPLPEATVLEPPGPVFVGCRPGVLAAVQLNDQVPFEAAEINDVPADGHLAAEVVTFQLPGAQTRPKADLRVC